MSSERDKGRIFIPIGCYSVRTFVLANRTQDLAIVLPTSQYFTAPFVHFWFGLIKFNLQWFHFGLLLYLSHFKSEFDAVK